MRYHLRLGSLGRVTEFGCESERSHEDVERQIVYVLAGGGWHPIVSAPRDGTRILAIRHGHSIPAVIAWNVWNDGWGDGPQPDEVMPVRMCVHQPTHWMPLPVPPEAP